jgi:hypothetical protein
LYLPTKLFVFEDADGAVHVSYDKFVPVMAPLGIPILIKWPERSMGRSRNWRQQR